MSEGVIVSKNVGSTCVIRRISINKFDLSAELLFEGVECYQVVAFDDEIFAYYPVRLSFEGGNLLFNILIMIYPPLDFVQPPLQPYAVSN